MSTNENYQEKFLNAARREGQGVTLFLMNGFQLRGVISAYDSYVVMLQSEGKQHMIYKHAISTVVPTTAIPLSQ